MLACRNWRAHHLRLNIASIRVMASDTMPPKSREKVRLKPGFHLVDWMNLMKTSDFSCRNGGPLRKISIAELASHTSQFDCWTAYNGKVYNITQYLHYHPGGVAKLMEGAGKDCTKAFNKYHAWVNIESMLSKCLVGILMADEEGIVEEDEHEDDDDAGDGVEKSGFDQGAIPQELSSDRDLEDVRRRAQAQLNSNEDCESIMGSEDSKK